MRFGSIRSPRRGFFLLDAIIGLMLLGVLTLMMAASLRNASAAAQRMGEQRSALRIAENSLTALQLGRAIEYEQVEIRPLDTPPPAQGFVWVEVRARVAEQSATLIGVVPVAAKPRAEEVADEPS